MQKPEVKTLTSSWIFLETQFHYKDGQGTEGAWTQKVRACTSQPHKCQIQKRFAYGVFISQCFPYVLLIDDTTGIHSIYTVYQGHELMFHVSTMLPYSKENKQQVSLWLPTILCCTGKNKTALQGSLSPRGHGYQCESLLLAWFHWLCVTLQLNWRAWGFLWGLLFQRSLLDCFWVTLIWVVDISWNFIPLHTFIVQYRTCGMQCWKGQSPFAAKE